eukprot:5299588-Pleurochrysis_carterae.AAC.1
MDCVWKVEKRGCPNLQPPGRKEARLARQGQPMDDVSSVSREAAENLTAMDILHCFKRHLEL